jgi:small conductance mechanosensitive channel
MDTNAILQVVQARVTAMGMQVAGALVLYMVGRWLISKAVGLVQKGLTKQQIEPTILRFVGNTIAVVLNIALVVAILGYFGVETTTFAALLAGIGLAIGTAWGGLLANFAAGAFLIVLRPFKVGDFVSAGGQVGTVEEIGLFVTTFHTPDNIKTFVGNNKIFSDTIQNYSVNPYRRVELVAQISGAADPHQAMSQMQARLKTIPNVVADPEPSVTILTFTLVGPVLAVRPFCHNDHYWQVYFDTNLAIREVLGSDTFPAAMPSMAIKQI